VVKVVGCGNDHSIAHQSLQLGKAWQICWSPTSQIGVAFDDLWPAHAAALCFCLPKVTPAHQGMVVLPLLPLPSDAWALNTPVWLDRRVTAIRHTDARSLHLLSKRMQNTDHNHSLRTAVQTGTHRSGDLMATLSHTGMRKDDHSAGA
jgi:hypothetical protein